MSELLEYRQYVAWQKNKNVRIKYNKEYFQKLKNYDNQDIGIKLNKFRVELVKKYMKPYESIIDIGAGSCIFIKKYSKISPYIFGYDINPYTVKELKKIHCYIDIKDLEWSIIKGLIFWDSFEHLENPAHLICNLSKDCYIFISIPIFGEIRNIEKSKHYRPNEHLWYFTKIGLINYLDGYNYELIEESDEESVIGRENIITFVFKRK